jgi:histone acetyltransferase 1
MGDVRYLQLSFASGSLRQYLNISYKSKLESTALEADDIEKKLYEFIPSGNRLTLFP